MKVPDYFLPWGKQNTLACVSVRGVIHLQYRASRIRPTLELHSYNQNAETYEICPFPTINEMKTDYKFCVVQVCKISSYT